MGFFCILVQNKNRSRVESSKFLLWTLKYLGVRVVGTGILLSFLFSRFLSVRAKSHSTAGGVPAHCDSAPGYHFCASFTFTFPTYVPGRSAICDVTKDASSSDVTHSSDRTWLPPPTLPGFHFPIPFQMCDMSVVVFSGLQVAQSKFFSLFALVMQLILRRDSYYTVYFTVTKPKHSCHLTSW